jgi:large subunit ribosomal protein L10
VNRLEKKQSISEIKDLTENHSAVMVAHYQGLTVSQFGVLRRDMRACGAKIKIIKNSLAKLAITKGEKSGLESFLSGPTALIVSNDPVTMAKALSKFSKENTNLSLLGGIVDGQVLNKKSIVLLSEMPSKDELRAKIIGLVNAPAVKLVRLMKTPAEQVARVIGAYSKK